VSQLEGISWVFASELNLTEVQRKQQIQSYLDYIKKELHWKSA